jgi:hypothetical protein
MNPFVFRYVLSPSGCWEWSGSYASNGRYGSLQWNGEPWSAHRAAYSVAKGPIPQGMSVCHRCDNTKCINPDHLFLGTQRENMRDAASKGRTARGEKCRSAITQATALEIKGALQSGEPQAAIARRLGVKPKLVNHIACKRSWVWLQQEAA